MRSPSRLPEVCGDDAWRAGFFADYFGGDDDLDVAPMPVAWRQAARVIEAGGVDETFAGGARAENQSARHDNRMPRAGVEHAGDQVEGLVQGGDGRAAAP